MGYENQRRAGGFCCLEQGGDDLLAGAAVQIACRLVGQKNARPRRDGTGNCHALLLAARHLVGKMRLAVAEPDRLQRRRGHLVGVAPPGKLHRHGDILQRRH